MASSGDFSVACAPPDLKVFKDGLYEAETWNLELEWFATFCKAIQNGKTIPEAVQSAGEEWDL